MPTIRERTDGSGVTTYQAQVRIKGHTPQSASFPTKTLAKRWAHQVETEIRSGSFKGLQGDKRTLAELLEHYRAQVLPGRAKGGRDDLAPLEWWKSNLGNRYLSTIDPAAIRSALNKLKETPTRRGRPPAPATVLRYLMLLSHAFTVAISELKWMQTNPVRSLGQRAKVDNGRTRFLNDDERHALLNACRESSSQHLLLVVVLAMFTGMRRGEILGLRWIDLTFSKTDAFAKANLVKTKNGGRRSAMIAGDAYKMLLAKRHAEDTDARKNTSSLLFPSIRNPQVPVDIRTPWETALKRAAISDFRFHDLRHTAASYLAQDGTTIQEIAAVLGHKSTRMAERYAHLTDERADEVVRRMSAKLSI